MFSVFHWKFWKILRCTPIFLCLALFTALSASAESFRVHKTVLLQVSTADTSRSVFAGVNDAIAVELPEENEFIEGIDVYFKVPQEVSYWMDSVAWSLYSGIKPEPSETKIDYKGKKETVGTFGSLLTYDIKLPLKVPNTIKQDSYSTYIETLPQTTGGKLFVRLQLAMKGTPDSLTDSLFEVSAKPIYINKGRLSLSVTLPEHVTPSPYTVFLDGKEVDLKEEGMLVTPGVHTLSIESESYRNEVRTVTVEQAKILSVKIQLKDIAPQIRLSAPKDTVAYCDDVPVQNLEEPFTVPQGKHTFRFVLGGYEIVKNLEALNGKNYTVAVTIDAEVTEEQ